MFELFVVNNKGFIRYSEQLNMVIQCTSLSTTVNGPHHREANFFAVTAL